MNSIKIHIALVDDDKLVTQLLADFFEQDETIKVCLQSYSGNSFLEKLETVKPTPDIVLLDLRMPDGNGMETLEKLHEIHPDLKIIVLSSYYKPSFMGHMLKLGVHAFLPKETDKETLLEVIYQVYQKGHYFTNEQLDILRSQIASNTTKVSIRAKDSFSERELEVLEWICKQYTAREIAEKLFVSVKTIEAHKANLLLKAGVKNTSGLIIYAIQNALIDPNSIAILD